MERRKRPEDGISRVQKVAAVEIGFRGAPGCFRRIWVYIGGRSKSVELRGAHEGEGRTQGWQARLPASWPPCSFLDDYSKSPGSVCSKNNSPDGFIPFGFRLIYLLRNTEIGKKTAIWTGPPVSRLVPKII